MKQILLFSIFVILLTNFVAAEPLFYFKAGTDVDLKVPCAYEGNQCSAAAVCNITINDPNSNNLVNNQQMTNSGAFHNYTLRDTELLGEYQATVFCTDNDESDYAAFSFATSENGFFNEGLTFILALAIMIIFCVVVALNLSENLIFLKILLLVFALIYIFLIPAFFVISKTKLIFYNTVLGMIVVIAIYAIIHLTKYVLEKFEVIGK